jgi:hypothetical protein
MCHLPDWVQECILLENGLLGGGESIFRDITLCSPLEVNRRFVLALQP